MNLRYKKISVLYWINKNLQYYVYCTYELPSGEKNTECLGIDFSCLSRWDTIYNEADGVKIKIKS